MTTFLRPLAEAPVEALRCIRLVATDIDGTMTRDGRLPGEVLQALVDLRAAGIEVLPITGRPAGEALGLARYLPTVDRAVAENGGVLIVPDAPAELLRPAPDRARLLDLAARLGAIGPRPWTLAPDAFCRLSDLAWLREDRHEAELEDLRLRAAAEQVHLIWSSVHIHLTEQPPDKGEAVLAVAARLGIAADTIATIGDAPNDAGLWQAGRFGLTVGTADVLAQRDVLPHLPAWTVSAPGADGWLELSRALIASRG